MKIENDVSYNLDGPIQPVRVHNSVKCPNPKNTLFPDHNPATCTYCGDGTELDNLKKAVRYAYLTLGFYATEYNYSEQSKEGTHPSLPGELGILRDRGKDAKEAMAKMELFLPNIKDLVK